MTGVQQSVDILLCIPFYNVHGLYAISIECGPEALHGCTPWHEFLSWVLSKTKTQNTMIRWTVIFLIIAIIAAIFGFGGIAASAAYFAKVIFFIAVVIFLVSLIAGATRRN
jgi:uncharacterized membrane protein YtjA (UPF0391 family)